MKFPRTYHLPWSPGRGSDDKVHTPDDIKSNFLRRNLIITEKLDGENQCWSRNSWHLRSESSTAGGILRSKSKAKWAEVQWFIPESEFWFVEDISNLHSIEYQDHLCEFFLIAVWDKKLKLWADHKYVELCAKKVDLSPAPVLVKGTSWDSIESLEEAVNWQAQQPSVLGGNREGVVVGIEDCLNDWTASTAKWVRANHVQTNQHWTRQRLKEL